MSDTLKDLFEEDGYVVLEEFLWPDECDELLEAGYELAEELPDKENRVIFSSSDASKQHLKDNYFLNSNDKIRPFFEKDALDAEGNIVVDPNVSLNKIGHALHLLDPVFRVYTYCDRVKTVCKSLELVNPAVVQSMLIFKNAKHGGEVLPHQDSTYLFTEPIPPVGFWIALEDTTIQNGCLWIAKGSHKSGVHRRLTRNPDPRIPEKLVYNKPPPVYPESNFTPVPVEKGTCIVLHGNVVHKSAANKSDRSRPAYTFHVVEKHNNTYAPENWLQEGDGAPFHDLYETLQLI